MRFFGRSVVLLSLVGISLFVGTPALAQTPTPATTIEDGGGATVFQSFVDGALLAPGTFGTGTIPAEGSGTRLMWHPAKAAFRAGRVGDGTDGLEWNSGNVGNYSVAFGRNTIASGSYSVAMGNGTSASGVGATAMGQDTDASGGNATAMGVGTAAATSSSLTIGSYNSANTSADNSLFVAGNGTSSSPSDALVLDNSGNLSIDGVFESGPTGSTYAGHFRGSKDQTDTGGPDSHIALVENTNTGISASGLAIQTGANTNPVAGNNYLTFYDGDGDPVGSIDGNGGGGVNYNSGGADFAEELPVAQGGALPEAADLVGVHGKTVHLRTDDANRIMIVSRAPLMTGNTTPATTADDDRRVPVAFIGQVPVRLRGEAEIGDLIVASGQNDGTARAVAPANYRRAEHGPIAGEAWAEKTTDDVGTVIVAVGLDHSGAVAEQMQNQRARIERLEAENESIKERLAALEAQSSGSVAAGWAGPWGIITVLSFLVGGLSGALLWREQA